MTFNSIKDFVRALVEAIEAAGVDYLVGGSISLWVWGELRSTLDADLVIDLPLDSIEKLSAELEKIDIYLPPDILLDNLLDTRGDLALHAIHGSSGYKADLFFVREGDELRQSALRRRRLADLGGVIGKVYVHAPEDLILYKLQYYSISRQTKHVRDINSILESKTPLDEAYLMGWIERKGLGAVWEEVRKGEGGSQG
jgi:hypothetical protein